MRRRLALDERGARLYVNGLLAADTASETLGRKRIVGSLAADGRPLGGRRPMRVGAHPDKTHPLMGMVDELLVWHEALDAAAIKRLHCGLHTAAAAELASAVLHLSFEATDEVTGLVPEPGPDGARPRFAVRGGTGSQAPTRLKLKESGKQKKRSRRSASDAAYEQPLNPEVPKGEWPLSWVTADDWRSKPKPTAEQVNASDALAYVRREHVRSTFRRAWRAYEKYAWGMDELKPMSNRSHNWLGLGATLVDCLDNLWIFGMHAEFRRAQSWVEKNLHFDRAAGISMFETVIRILGGLLSAFELVENAARPA